MDPSISASATERTTKPTRAPVVHCWAASIPDLGDGEQTRDTREEEHADDQNEAELQLELERRADSRNPAPDGPEGHRLGPTGGQIALRHTHE